MKFMDVCIYSFLVFTSYIPLWQKRSRIKIRTSRFIMSEKRLISSILICLVLHRRIGWRRLFGVPIDRERVVVIVCYRFCLYTLTLHRLINKSLLEMFFLLFCLVAQCSSRTQVSWKSCSNCVLQILLLHAYVASLYITHTYTQLYLCTIV